MRFKLHLIAAITILIGQLFFFTSNEDVGLAVTLAAFPMWIFTTSRFWKEPDRP